ncbi:cupin domain-containing protein [Uliginosibacterium sp. sgz301328]|uniref:cupin domain-containing protein n=1 Tax=Uliginosibacterium sp. sgz301328 TaxID=3243764 RepID=UPI00359E7A6D
MAMPPLQRLTHGLPAPGTDEDILPLYASQGVLIERIVSHRHASPPGFWYDQPHDEWVTLVQGRAELQFEEGSQQLVAGDSVLIPAHCRHRVASTGTDTVWLAVHLPVVAD